MQSLIVLNTVLTLQEATPFKDGNLTIFSFLNSGKIFKHMGNFYSHKQIQQLKTLI
jgi:hypothetical protein